MSTASKSVSSTAASTAAGDETDCDLIALGLQKQLQRFQNVGLIVGEEDAWNP